MSEIPQHERVWKDAFETPDRRIVIQPGRPDAEVRSAELDVDPYSSPRVYVLNDFDGTILERGRRLSLRGTWRLRQYRQRTPCGAQFNLIPGPDAAYQWEVME